MKKTLLIFVFSLLTASLGFSQTEKAWSNYKGQEIKVSKSAQRESFPQDFKLMQLDLAAMKQVLLAAPNRLESSKSNSIISIPNSEGILERFEMFEASNFDAELQAQFPEIRSFVGQGIDDKKAILRLSVDPRGIQTMIFRADKGTEFMEPYSEDNKVYAVYQSSTRRNGKLPFTCSTSDQELINDLSTTDVTSRSSTGSLLNFRLALSCNGEYSNYFGATSAAQVANVLAAFNATMTRVNGVFEKDFAIHMNIVASTTNVIYYNPTTDPYTTMANWNTQLQQALNTTLTGPATTLAANNAAYDVGHMFGSTGGGGNAGCIGCVCVNGITAGTGSTKGRGITSPADGVPQGDTFDIDYVAHELGHQFGANHTFSNANEGTGVNKEVGGGVTIMGYAGITSYNTHMNSIDIFHAASIAQVQANMATKTCPTTTAITHSAPVVNAGANYTIPINTPFMLTGSATDAGGTSTLTYAWEQNDDGGSNIDAASVASPTKTTGPNFVCYPASSSPIRYLPNMTSVLNGSTTTQGVGVTMEALSSVARTLNFRLTARDNVAGQGQTNFDDMVVTVANIAALNVTSQNTDGISYPTGSTQTITWTSAGNSGIAGGANVDILLSTDGGVTWSTLLAGTPNDGSQAVTLPSTAAPFCRFMVKASANIFFNVNTKNFAIGYVVTNTCNTYSNNTALTVPDGTGANTPGAVVSKTIAVPAPTQTISDVNVTLGFTHTYIEDLVIAMNHPDNTQVVLWNRNCDNAPGSLTYVFSDGNPTVPTTGCTATTGTFAPNTSLAAYNGKVTNGTWTLLAADYYNGDTGDIESWSIELCYQQIALATESFSINDLSIYPNPNNGNFNIQFTSNSGNEIKVGVHDMRGREIFTKSYTNNGLFNENLQLSGVQAGIYLVTIQDGSSEVTKKIVVE